MVKLVFSYDNNYGKRLHSYWNGDLVRGFSQLENGGSFHSYVNVYQRVITMVNMYGEYVSEWLMTRVLVLYV
jgi:hypothetical protein